MKFESLSPCRLISITAFAFVAATFPQSGRAQSPTLTPLYQFSGTDGANPFAGLVQGSDGNFYGTTNFGGTSDFGTVFKITPTGALTTLHRFSGTAGGDGARPRRLIQGNDGNFYGTTRRGGTSNVGTVFQITPAGVLTILHSFNSSDGDGPQAGLIQGNDGSFYGTTSAGGQSGHGTAFKITAAGVLTTLHSFPSEFPQLNGLDPEAGLTQGSDGNFYGTTYGGGAAGVGTVFKMTPTGTLTTLRGFNNGNDGANPAGKLVQGSDGFFYGTNYNGGTNNMGTIFRANPSGGAGALYTFSGPDGANPYAGLIQGGDGNFYGMTEAGGTSGLGTLFKITAAGALTTLYSFSGSSDGAYPDYELLQGSDGNLYGTAPYGGTVVGSYTQGAGTIFRLNIAPVTLKILFITHPASNTIHLQCVGLPNVVNRLESSPDLSPSSFSPITPPPPAADATGAFPYDDSIAGTRKFYQLSPP